MKKNYLVPQSLIIEMQEEDILTTSMEGVDTDLGDAGEDLPEY